MPKGSWNNISDQAIARVSQSKKYPRISEDNKYNWTVDEALEASGRIVLSKASKTYGDVIQTTQGRFVAAFGREWGPGASGYINLWKKTLTKDLRAVRAEEVKIGKICETFSDFRELIGQYRRLDPNGPANYVELNRRLNGAGERDAADIEEKQIEPTGGGGAKESDLEASDVQTRAALDFVEEVLESSTEGLEDTPAVSPMQSKGLGEKEAVIQSYSKQLEGVYEEVDLKAIELAKAFPSLGTESERNRVREQKLQDLREFADQKRMVCVGAFSEEEQVFIQTKGKVRAWKKQVEKLMDGAIAKKDTASLRLYSFAPTTIPREFWDTMKACLKHVAEKTAFTSCDLDQARLGKGEKFQDRADYLMFGAFGDWVEDNYSDVACSLVESEAVLTKLKDYVDPYFEKLITITRWKYLGCVRHIFFKEILFKELALLEIANGEPIFTTSKIIDIEHIFMEREDLFLECRRVWSFTDSMDEFYDTIQTLLITAASLSQKPRVNETRERFLKRMHTKMNLMSQSLRAKLIERVDTCWDSGDPMPTVEGYELALEQPRYKIMVDLCKNLEGEFAGGSQKHQIFSSKEMRDIQRGVERCYQENIHRGEEEVERQVLDFIRRKIKLAIRSKFPVEQESLSSATDAMFACFQQGYLTEMVESSEQLDATLSEKIERSVTSAAEVFPEFEIQYRPILLDERKRDFLFEVLEMKQAYIREERLDCHFITRGRINEALFTFEEQLRQRLEDEGIEMPTEEN